MSSMVCRFCDSKLLEPFSAREEFQIPFCDSAVINYQAVRCLHCGEEWIEDAAESTRLEQSIAAAHASSAPVLVARLENAGISMTNLERVMHLPFGISQHWRSAIATPAELALLRLLMLDPELLDRADEAFMP